MDLGQQVTDIWFESRELLPHVQSRSTKTWLSIALDVPEEYVR